MKPLKVYGEIREGLEDNRRLVVEFETTGFLNGTIATVISRDNSPGSVKILEETVKIPFFHDSLGNPDKINGCKYRVMVLKGKDSHLYSQGQEYAFKLLNVDKWYNEKERHIRNILGGDCDLLDEEDFEKIIKQTYKGVPDDQIPILLELYSKQNHLTNFEKSCGKLYEGMVK